VLSCLGRSNDIRAEELRASGSASRELHEAIENCRQEFAFCAARLRSILALQHDLEKAGPRPA
jgi:hypothetical protein